MPAAMAMDPDYEFDGPDGEGQADRTCSRGRRQPGSSTASSTTPDRRRLSRARAAPAARSAPTRTLIRRHLNAPRHDARVTSSRAPAEKNIAGLKEAQRLDRAVVLDPRRFDVRYGPLGVRRVARHTNAFHPRRRRQRPFRTYFIDSRGDEADGHHVELPSTSPRTGPAGGVGGLARRHPRRPSRTSGGNYHDAYAGVVIIAHVRRGVPVEELLPSLGGVGWRACSSRAPGLAFHLRRRQGSRRVTGDQVPDDRADVRRPGREGCSTPGRAKR